VEDEPEFIYKDLEKWAYKNGVTLDFPWSGKPPDNALVKSFNGSLCDEYLNSNRFLSVEGQYH
jgi:putative transposase